MTTFDAQYQNTQPDSPKVDKLHKITVKSLQKLLNISELQNNMFTAMTLQKKAKYGMFASRQNARLKTPIRVHFIEPKLVCYQKGNQSHQAGCLTDRQSEIRHN